MFDGLTTEPLFGGAAFPQFGALPGQADFGEAQENEPEDRASVFLRLEARVGAELIGGIPKALFQRVSGGVLRRWRNALHEIQSSSSLGTLRGMVFQMVSKTTEKGQPHSYQQFKLAIAVHAEWVM